MKSFEDLEILTIPQLTAIATDLGVEIPKGAKKADIVQLVYDIQQPTPDEHEDAVDTAPEENKPTNTQEDFDKQLEVIVEHFKGTAAVEVDEIDGATVFAVVDELTDQELARGTFLELSAQAAPKPNELVDLDKEAGTGVNDVAPTNPAFEEVNTETPPLADSDNLVIIEEGLAPLRHYGLKWTIDGSVIRFAAGSKIITTTLNQPTHRVIRTGQQLVNR